MRYNGLSWGVRLVIAVLAVWVAVADARVTPGPTAPTDGVSLRTTGAKAPSGQWTPTDLAALVMMVLGAAVPFIPMDRRLGMKGTVSTPRNDSTPGSIHCTLPNPPRGVARIYNLPSRDWAIHGGSMSNSCRSGGVRIVPGMN